MLIWDHPRLRGEHVLFIASISVLLGSPPPTRGTRCYIRNMRVCVGITPAYAGNTISSRPCSIVFEDHPRLRGEHLRFRQIGMAQWGSPPPTRGTLLSRADDLINKRITPAYAGNTYIIFFNSLINQDHPRLRGEHGFTNKQISNQIGSPPPTRGTP